MKLQFLPISHCKKNYLSAVPVDFGAADRTLSLGPMSRAEAVLWQEIRLGVAAGCSRRRLRGTVELCERALNSLPIDVSLIHFDVAGARWPMVGLRTALDGSCSGHQSRVPQVRECDRIRHFRRDSARRQRLSRSAAAHVKGGIARLHAAEVRGRPQRLEPMVEFQVRCQLAQTLWSALVDQRA